MGSPDGGHRPWSLRRWMFVVSAVSAAVTVLALVIGAVALAQLGRARGNLVDRLDPELLNAQRLALALVKQDIGVRGFVATRDPSLLVSYRDGLRQERDALAGLRRLVGSSAGGPDRAALAAVTEASARWHDEYAEPTMAAVQAGAPAPPAEAGEALFDTLRARLAAKHDQLAALRDSARSALDGAASRLAQTGLGIAVALVMLLVALGLWTRRSIVAPISQLAVTVRGVVTGEFGRRVSVEAGPREISELATDVDSMRARIVTELSTLGALNERLAIQAEELARSNRDLEQFAYVASHDLQEPLRKVTGFCELLAARYAEQLDERAQTYIGYAVDGARRMSTLINDLLAFSRVGRTETKMSAQEAEALLASALRNLDESITDSGAVVTHDPLSRVLGQPTLLVTLFQNLISNAMKFHGDRPPRVHVGAEPAGSLWTFRVTDDGIGIDPAYGEKIFVIFQRLHPKGEYPGTGIGLAVCRKIVEYHGGRIWLDAEHVEAGMAGATFAFTLPMAPNRPHMPRAQLIPEITRS
jgi:signal transduction histidine kinase